MARKSLLEKELVDKQEWQEDSKETEVFMRNVVRFLDGKEALTDESKKWLEEHDYLEDGKIALEDPVKTGYVELILMGLVHAGRIERTEVKK